MKHTINGETMKFGYKEMREFSELSGDVRVKAMMMRIEEHIRKLALSNDTINKLQNEFRSYTQLLTTGKHKGLSGKKVV